MTRFPNVKAHRHVPTHQPVRVFLGQQGSHPIRHQLSYGMLLLFALKRAT